MESSKTTLVMLSMYRFWSSWSNMFENTNIWNRWLKQMSTVAADAGSINPIEKKTLTSENTGKEQSKNRAE